MGNSLATFFLTIMIIYFAVILLIIIAFWKIYTKAGQPGWASIIPIYNIYIFGKIVGMKNWWLMIVPFIGLIFSIIAILDLTKSFGKSSGFAAGMIFLPFIFFPILAFGDAFYIGPKGQNKFSNDINAIGNN